jgi:hypothetical protein
MRAWKTRWIRKCGLFVKPGQRSIEEWLKREEEKKDER